MKKSKIRIIDTVVNIGEASIAFNSLVTITARAKNNAMEKIVMQNSPK